MKRLSFFSLILIAVLFVSSCAQGNPEIHSCVVQLLRVQGQTGAFAERLSLFVFFDDSDGPADFGSITFTHKDTELSWKIVPENCQVRLRGKDRWTGSNALAGPGDEPFPAGVYTITVADLAGNETSGIYTLTRPDFPEQSPFRFTVNGDSWKLERNGTGSDFNRVWLLLYDRDGKILNSWRVPDMTKPVFDGSVKTLQTVAKNTVSVQCYIENSTGSAGVLLTPVSLQ